MKGRASRVTPPSPNHRASSFPHLLVEIAELRWIPDAPPPDNADSVDARCVLVTVCVANTNPCTTPAVAIARRMVVGKQFELDLEARLLGCVAVGVEVWLRHGAQGDRSVLLGAMEIQLVSSVTDRWYALDRLGHTHGPRALPCLAVRVSTRLLLAEEQRHLTGREWLSNKLGDQCMFDVDGMCVPPHHIASYQAHASLRRVLAPVMTAQWQSAAKGMADGVVDWKAVVVHNRDLVWQGFPAEFRQQAYLSCVARGCLESFSSKAALAESLSNLVSEQIDRDLRRTIPPRHSTKVNTEEGIRSLRRVLGAFAMHCPRIGYCQGLNYIAAQLLFRVDEECAFASLVHICEDIVPAYYVSSMQGLIVDMQCGERLLRMQTPAVMHHIDALDCPLNLYTSQWFACLFVTAFPSELAYRILDVLMFEGSSVLLAVTVAFFNIHETQILAVEGDGQDLLDTIKALAAALHDHDLLMAEARRQLDSWHDIVPALRAEIRHHFSKRFEGTIKRHVLNDLDARLSLGVGDCDRIYDDFVAHVERSSRHAVLASARASSGGGGSFVLVNNPGGGGDGGSGGGSGVEESPKRESHASRRFSIIDDRALNFAQFSDFIHNVLPLYKHNARFLFEAFDLDGNNAIDADEMICCLGVINTHATPQDKLASVFRAFDRDNDGKLDTHSLPQLLRAVFLVGAMASKMNNRPEEVVEGEAEGEGQGLGLNGAQSDADAFVADVMGAKELAGKSFVELEDLRALMGQVRRFRWCIEQCMLGWGSPQRPSKARQHIPQQALLPLPVSLPVGEAAQEGSEGRGSEEGLREGHNDNAEGEEEDGGESEGEGESESDSDSDEEVYNNERWAGGEGIEEEDELGLGAHSRVSPRWAGKDEHDERGPGHSQHPHNNNRQSANTNSVESSGPDDADEDGAGVVRPAQGTLL